MSLAGTEWLVPALSFEVVGTEGGLSRLPGMAPFGHGAMSEWSPVSGVERKLDFETVWAAF
jgi:hypothetical protein